MDLGLKGKKVIMNGGAHGLGLASLKLFAAEGADVAFFSRKEDKRLENIDKRLRQLHVQDGRKLPDHQYVADQNSNRVKGELQPDAA